MTPQEAKDLIPLLALDELEEPKRSELLAFLDATPGARAQYQTLRETFLLLEEGFGENADLEPVIPFRQRPWVRPFLIAAASCTIVGCLVYLLQNTTLSAEMKASRSDAYYSQTYTENEPSMSRRAATASKPTQPMLRQMEEVEVDAEVMDYTVTAAVPEPPTEPTVIVNGSVRITGTMQAGGNVAVATPAPPSVPAPVRPIVSHSMPVLPAAATVTEEVAQLHDELAKKEQALNRTVTALRDAGEQLGDLQNQNERLVADMHYLRAPAITAEPVEVTAAPVPEESQVLPTYASVAPQSLSPDSNADLGSGVNALEGLGIQLDDAVAISGEETRTAKAPSARPKQKVAAVDSKPAPNPLPPSITPALVIVNDEESSVAAAVRNNSDPAAIAPPGAALAQITTATGAIRVDAILGDPDVVDTPITGLVSEGLTDEDALFAFGNDRNTPVPSKDATDWQKTSSRIAGGKQAHAELPNASQSVDFVIADYGVEDSRVTAKNDNAVEGGTVTAIAGSEVTVGQGSLSFSSPGNSVAISNSTISVGGAVSVGNSKARFREDGQGAISGGGGVLHSRDGRAEKEAIGTVLFDTNDNGLAPEVDMLGSASSPDAPVSNLANSIAPTFELVNEPNQVNESVAFNFTGSADPADHDGDGIAEPVVQGLDVSGSLTVAPAAEAPATTYSYNGGRGLNSAVDVPVIAVPPAPPKPKPSTSRKGKKKVAPEKLAQDKKSTVEVSEGEQADLGLQIELGDSYALSALDSDAATIVTSGITGNFEAQSPYAEDANGVLSLASAPDAVLSRVEGSQMSAGPALPTPKPKESEARRPGLKGRVTAFFGFDDNDDEADAKAPAESAARHAAMPVAEDSFAEEGAELLEEVAVVHDKDRRLNYRAEQTRGDELQLVNKRLIELEKGRDALRDENLDVVQRLSIIDTINPGQTLKAGEIITTSPVSAEDKSFAAPTKIVVNPSMKEDVARGWVDVHKKIDRLGVQQQELSQQGYTPTHPKVAAVEREIVELKQELAAKLSAVEERLEWEQAKLQHQKRDLEGKMSVGQERDHSDLAAVIVTPPAPVVSEDDSPLPPAPPKPAPPVNPFVLTEKDAQSTFALEADTAAYTLSRRYIRKGYNPPPAVVRMEEFINAFDYQYPAQTEHTFVVHADAAPAPFGKDLTLLKVGVRGKVLGRDGRKPAHLIFVVDASGSMARDDRMPLVQHSLRLLVSQLGAEDRVTLITYGTRSQLMIEAMPAVHRDKIGHAIQLIECSDSTNLLSGIQAGYSLAQRHFRAGEVNRIILCSDGVANLGPTDADALLSMVEDNRGQGITFTSVGVGAGSYDDSMMEQLANRGDGNYVYIDSPAEAHRVFVENFSATLQTIARDVKIQVEFNPAKVRRYRLIGYENRDIADKDFRNDKVDAGEIGSGQSATALYELELHDGADSADFGTVFVRYKGVDTDEVTEFARRLAPEILRLRTPQDAPRFYLAACVAEFAEILRGSEHAGPRDFHAMRQVLIKVANALPLDDKVQEFLKLVENAQDQPVFGK